MILVAFVTLLLVAVVVALQVKALLLISEYLPCFPFRPLFKVSAGFDRSHCRSRSVHCAFWNNYLPFGKN